MSGVMDFEVKEVMDYLVNEVVKREEMKKAGVIQVGGASLTEMRKRVTRGEGAFSNFVTVVNHSGGFS
ncbi:unnamed protein product [Caenorhabditis brenneri]